MHYKCHRVGREAFDAPIVARDGLGLLGAGPGPLAASALWEFS